MRRRWTVGRRHRLPALRAGERRRALTDHSADHLTDTLAAAEDRQIRPREALGSLADAGGQSVDQLVGGDQSLIPVAERSGTNVDRLGLAGCDRAPRVAVAVRRVLLGLGVRSRHDLLGLCHRLGEGAPAAPSGEARGEAFNPRSSPRSSRSVVAPPLGCRGRDWAQDLASAEA